MLINAVSRVLLEHSTMASEKFPGFTPVQLESRISVSEAAKIRGISEDTFRRNYSPVIEKLSVRRSGVKLRHVLADAAPAKPR